MELNNIIFSFFLIFFGYFFIKYLLLILQKSKSNFLADNQFNKPQAFHEKTTHRLGGLVIFSLLMLTAFDCIMRLASPLLANTFVFSASTSKIPELKSVLLISNCGTPSNTERKVSSSKDFKSAAVDLLNNMEDAFIAIAKASLLCTLVVTSSAIAF